MAKLFVLIALLVVGDTKFDISGTTPVALAASTGPAKAENAVDLLKDLDPLILKYLALLSNPLSLVDLLKTEVPASGDPAGAIPTTLPANNLPSNVATPTKGSIPNIVPNTPASPETPAPLNGPSGVPSVSPPASPETPKVPGIGDQSSNLPGAIPPKPSGLGLPAIQ